MKTFSSSQISVRTLITGIATLAVLMLLSTPMISMASADEIAHPHVLPLPQDQSIKPIPQIPDTQPEETHHWTEAEVLDLYTSFKTSGSFAEYPFTWDQIQYIIDNKIDVPVEYLTAEVMTAVVVLGKTEEYAILTTGLQWLSGFKTKTLNAAMGVAWPFGKDCDLNAWRGWEGSRTAGGSWSGCQKSTHAGADYFARDLSRNNCHGVSVYAGIFGKIVKAGYTDCYGKCIVIYDPNRRVALRYAHLDSIGRRVGEWVYPGHYLGTLGNTGCPPNGNSGGSHLHLAAYENINDNRGNPIIPYLCDSDFYTCATYFYNW